MHSMESVYFIIPPHYNRLGKNVTMKKCLLNSTSINFDQSISNFLKLPSTPKRSVALLPLPGRTLSSTLIVASSSWNHDLLSSSHFKFFSINSAKGPALPPFSFGSISNGTNFVKLSFDEWMWSYGVTSSFLFTKNRTVEDDFPCFRMQIFYYSIFLSPKREKSMRIVKDL